MARIEWDDEAKGPLAPEITPDPTAPANPKTAASSLESWFTGENLANRLETEQTARQTAGATVAGVLGGGPSIMAAAPKIWSGAKMALPMAGAYAGSELSRKMGAPDWLSNLILGMAGVPLIGAGARQVGRQVAKGMAEQGAKRATPHAAKIAKQATAGPLKPPPLGQAAQQFKPPTLPLEAAVPQGRNAIVREAARGMGPLPGQGALADIPLPSPLSLEQQLRLSLDAMKAGLLRKGPR